MVPNFTPPIDDKLSRLVPVIVIVVPPVIDPLLREIEDTVGTDKYVNCPYNEN